LDQFEEWMMTKVNNIIYKKLLLQAEEAKEQGLNKLASSICGAIGPVPEDERLEYSHAKMNDDIHYGLWKLATHILKYHDLESVDAEKIDQVIEALASKFVKELEESLGIDPVKAGPLEPKLLGESK